MTRAAAAAIARTVLYEGYLLYPYRASSVKNQRRWTLGAIMPRAWCEAANSGDRWRARTELVARATAGATVGGAVRFLHAGVERELELPVHPLGALDRETSCHELDGLACEVTRAAIALGGGLWRIAIEVANTSVVDARLGRDDATALALASAHVVVELGGGELVSLVDPPADAAEAAAGCIQDGLWPALVASGVVLAAPIVLPDRPELAPESPGDLFDATEIDEVLILRILTMTEAEKREARAGDARVATVIDRCEALGPEAVLALHGRGRVGPAVGDPVTLRPAPGGDVIDAVLAGRAATVIAVEQDFDGRVHVGVTIDDDPGADLGAAGFPGHRFFFSIDEVESR